MVLRKIFGSKRDEVRREWRKVRHEELNDLYCIPDIIQVIKSRMMRWAERLIHAWFSWVNMGKTDCVEDIGVGRKIIFKWIFKKYGGDVD